jgi:hypothetical protein
VIRSLVTLHLPGQPVRSFGQVEGADRMAVRDAVMADYPLLPPACVQVDGFVLPVLPVCEGLTEGQRAWRGRRRRRRLAERWRAHWIAKAG